MKYFSTFSGIGGFELGLQQAYSRVEDERQKNMGLRSEGVSKGQNNTGTRLSLPERHNRHLGNSSRPVCIGYSEIDKYAIKVYERHFNHPNYGNATTINPADLPDFDLLVGGFPCQAFSVAGKRLGFNETRGTLFFDIARILKHKRPGHLVLENVKGLLSHDSGKTFQTIIGVLTDLGYFVEWQVLNSKDFSVPQNRERVFIIGHLGGECGRQIFPLSGSKQQDSEPGDHEQQRTQKFIKTRYLGQNGSLVSDRTTLQATELPHIIGTINRKQFKETGGRSLTITANYYKGHDNHGQRPMVSMDSHIRRLTPKECERLQGFPDDWTALDQDGNPISDTQRYKMCGNAVTVNVVQAVMENMSCL